MRDFGGIDTLVNNAGAATVDPTEEHSRDSWERVIAANLTRVFLFTRHTVIQQRYGNTVNMSHHVGDGGNLHMPASSCHASSVAVSTLTTAVAAERVQYNVTVNAPWPLASSVRKMTDDGMQLPGLEGVRRDPPGGSAQFGG